MKTADLTPSQAFIDDHVSALRKLVLLGQYRRGVKIAQRALKQFPQDFVCRYQYAKLLGDWADELPLPKQKKLKKEAAKILLPLTRSLAGKSAEIKFGVCVNYYYQSKTYVNMYAFGKRFAKTDKQKGVYSQALGAGLYAYDLFKAGRIGQAKNWAQKSILAWQKYSLAKEKYYFAHYSYAKSLAVNGQGKKALVALKRAATLSKRKLSDWEFADVLELIV